MTRNQNHYYTWPLQEIRDREYPQLQNHCYLDHAGTTIYSKSLIDKLSARLLSNVYANPHSQSLASQKTESLINETRLQVLNLFHCNPLKYGVIFTANATHAIKILVQDGFATYSENFNYIYLDNSHTSALGIRQYSNCSRMFSLSPEALEDAVLEALSESNSSPTLLSWSCQSNFNGERVKSAELLRTASKLKSKFSASEIFTLLDISSLSTTSPPNLQDVPIEDAPDFMVCSFYKMFGMPDIGGLIFKIDSASQLFSSKKYFGGGTVDALTPSPGFVKRSSSITTKLEDGTLPLHSIMMLKDAIKSHEDIYGSFENISRHVTDLSVYGLSQLTLLRHRYTNQPMVEIFGNVSNYGNSTLQGPIITFSLKSPTGKRIGYYHFERAISLKNIALRTGTLCNIGGFIKWTNDLTEEDIIKNYYQHGHKCGDANDLIDGKITGAIRISFGAMSSKDDVDKLVESIVEYFQDTLNENTLKSTIPKRVKIKSLYIYPIKSCHFYEIPEGTEWRINEKGLQYDRQFCLLDIESKSPIKLKNCTRMVDVKPYIDLARKAMVLVDDKHHSKIVIPLDLSSLKSRFSIKVVKRDNIVYDCITDQRVVDYFIGVVEKPCYLAYCRESKDKVASLQNKSPFLLISQPSVNSIIESNKQKLNTQRVLNVAHLFRANILVDDTDGQRQAFSEDFWKYMKLIKAVDAAQKEGQPLSEEKLAHHSSQKTLVFDNYQKCERCHMITINQDTGERDVSVFMHLNKERKKNGMIYFGQHLKLLDSDGAQLNKGIAPNRGGSDQKQVSWDQSLLAIEGYIKVNDFLEVVC